jgi:hypothetical protein
MNQILTELWIQSIIFINFLAINWLASTLVITLPVLAVFLLAIKRRK